MLLYYQRSALTKYFTGGVHHWDENGLRNPKNEPADIQKIHAEIVHFVKEWLKDWKPSDD